MKTQARIILALLAAALAPAIAFCIQDIFITLLSGTDHYYISAQLGFGCVLVFVVALTHAVVLGLPAYFLFRRLNLIHWWSSIICGFVIGCVPNTVLSPYPRAFPGTGFTSHGVTLIDDTFMNFQLWMSYVLRTIEFGCYGALGGFAAWCVWLLTRSSEKPTRGHKIASAISIMSALVVILLINMWNTHLWFNHMPPEYETHNTIVRTVQRIELYACLHKSLPPSLDVLPERKGHDNKITDAWNQPLQYKVADGKLTVFSFGNPDKSKTNSGKDIISETYYTTKQDGTLWPGQVFWMVEANVMDCPRPADGKGDPRIKGTCEAFSNFEKKNQRTDRGSTCTPCDPCAVFR